MLRRNLAPLIMSKIASGPFSAPKVYLKIVATAKVIEFVSMARQNFQ
jgi:hypothetical protein